MSVPNPYVRYSYDDYRSLVASTDKRYELLDGEIVMVPSPTTGHQRISRNLEFLLVTFVKAHRLGEIFYAPMDVVFGEWATREVAQPDLVYVSSERRSIITEHAIEGAPHLVVEILSPGSEALSRGYKQALYARYGVASTGSSIPRPRSSRSTAWGRVDSRRGGVINRTTSLPRLCFRAYA